MLLQLMEFRFPGRRTVTRNLRKFGSCRLRRVGFLARTQVEPGPIAGKSTASGKDANHLIFASPWESRTSKWPERTEILRMKNETLAMKNEMLISMREILRMKNIRSTLNSSFSLPERVSDRGTREFGSGDGPAREETVYFLARSGFTSFNSFFTRRLVNFVE